MDVVKEDNNSYDPNGMLVKMPIETPESLLKDIIKPAKCRDKAQTVEMVLSKIFTKYLWCF